MFYARRAYILHKFVSEHKLLFKLLIGSCVVQDMVYLSTLNERGFGGRLRTQLLNY